jgi:hypothetical protein
MEVHPLGVLVHMSQESKIRFEDTAGEDGSLTRQEQAAIDETYSDYYIIHLVDSTSLCKIQGACRPGSKSEREVGPITRWR